MNRRVHVALGYRLLEFVSGAGASCRGAGGRGRRWHGGWWVSWLLLGLVWVRAAEEPLRWRWSNPAPHGNNIVDLAYSAELGLAVQVTERGQVYSSTDLSDWIPRESGTRKALRAATFLGSRLIITGEEGTVLFGDQVDAIRAGVLTEGPTLDWLEGCAASSDRVVAVGDNGAIYSSTDGSSWQRHSSGSSTWLRGIAYGAGMFVAVGETGTILNSANGADWVKVSSGTSADLNRVTYTGTQFVVVGDGGVVRVSASGSSWQNQSPNTSKDLLDVGVSGATRLVVGDDEVRRYENGTWSNEIGRVLGPPPWMYYSVMGRADGFLIAGQTGLMVEGRRMSGGGFSWEEWSPSARNWLFDMAWVTNLYVAVGDRGTVMTSVEGVDWDLEVVPEGLASAVLLGVGGTTNLLVAAGSQGSLMISPNTVTNLVWTNDFGTVITQKLSTLGLVWHAVEPRPVTNDLQGVTFHAGRHYVSGGAGAILSSVDGLEWTAHQAPTTKFLSGIAGFPGGLVAVGDDGAMVLSALGDDWVALPELTTNWLYRVRYLNGTLLAVGQGGVIYASTNAVNWEPRVSGTTQWLNDVSWVDGHYYVAGTQGTVLRSPDGLVWTSLGTITAKSLYALATDGSYLLAAGLEGVIVRARLVPDLTPIEILAYSRLDGPETGSHQNLFLFGGRVDQRFTLDYGTVGDGGGWTTGPLIEFLGRSGTVYYLQTVSGGNPPPTEYYRGTMVP
jgi:hypothetical protein